MISRAETPKKMTDNTPANNPYETGLPQTPANYAALTPLGFLARTAGVYPERTSVGAGEKGCRQGRHGLHYRAKRAGHL
jgi:hypothetical protein